MTEHGAFGAEPRIGTAPPARNALPGQRAMTSSITPAANARAVITRIGECERVVQILSRLPDREYQRPTDVSKAFGELARNYLERVPYPAGRDDLVASMREQGADEIVLDTIIMIPSQEYRNPDAVIVEIETSVLGATCR